MSESHQLRDLLLPELESELATTRRMLAAIPDGKHDFKCHEKSMELAKLAGHTAELPMFAVAILTGPSMDMAVPNARARHQYESTQQNLAAFDAAAEKAVTALKNSSDEALNQTWSLSHGDLKIFNGNRYNGYRTLAINHLVHHRAQLGVYLRLLGTPVPKTYGPSADEM